MIDIEVDFLNELARLVLADYPEAYISNEYTPVPGSFPALFVLESSNVLANRLQTSSDEEEGASLTYTIEVAHPSAKDGKATCKAILGTIDDRMRMRNMTRTMCEPVKNAENPSIYRMIARYTGIVDRFGTHFRR